MTQDLMLLSRIMTFLLYNPPASVGCSDGDPPDRSLLTPIFAQVPTCLFRIAAAILSKAVGRPVRVQVRMRGMAGKPRGGPRSTAPVPHSARMTVIDYAFE